VRHPNWSGYASESAADAAAEDRIGAYAVEPPTPEEDAALSLELARENADADADADAAHRALAEADRPGAVLTRVCDGVRSYGHATGLTTQEITGLVGVVLKAIEGFYTERLIQRSRADQRKHAS
jgi:hypothetical protein